MHFSSSSTVELNLCNETDWRQILNKRKWTDLPMLRDHSKCKYVLYLQIHLDWQSYYFRWKKQNKSYTHRAFTWGGELTELLPSLIMTFLLQHLVSRITGVAVSTAVKSWGRLITSILPLGSGLNRQHIVFVCLHLNSAPEVWTIYTKAE